MSKVFVVESTSAIELLNFQAVPITCWMANVISPLTDVIPTFQKLGVHELIADIGRDVICATSDNGNTVEEVSDEIEIVSSDTASAVGTK
jgi:hypothetical protein